VVLGSVRREASPFRYKAGPIDLTPFIAALLVERGVDLVTQHNSISVASPTLDAASISDGVNIWSNGCAPSVPVG